ncbi:MAG TPA: flagellar hook-basal body protein [Candidatus Hydrogenedentes bacterium]|nr:flagellar hook-basal body protein [Candidatus Hydrogenedentota bacterium]HOJ67602.1 flagellar hook-basal body protein [Candidatus Hydrogenedentota bacterium]HOK88529.1 flagellar hook-basal body protein [Candidatus Hydrogenedentota bacterium]HOV60510.1 flagellar hook-basal body protein [Candidatus Hydrogenedentota bacterium]
MLKGLYAAASGMVTLQERQDVLANNVANAATPGFRRHIPVSLGFYDLFSGTLRSSAWFRGRSTAPGGGLKPVETWPDPAQGPLQTTSNPLDIALTGPGFLAVETPNGPRWTRNGHLSVDPSGRLTTPDGYPVLAASGGYLDVRGGAIHIAEDGSVTVDNRAVGKLRIDEFDHPERLVREGASLARLDATAAGNDARAATATRVVQGALEASNVNLGTEMAGLMAGLRAYEANQKVVTAFDDTLGKLIDQVAMPR